MLRLFVLSLALSMLLLTPSAQAGKIVTKETSLADIRQYQTQLTEELEAGRLRKVPKDTKAALHKRNAALSSLLASPTAGTNEAELEKIGQEFVRLQNAAEQAAGKVVKCRRTASLGSRLGNQECRSVAEIEAEAERARDDLRDRTFNDIQGYGE